MQNMSLEKEIMSEWNEEMLFADGFDDCIVGIIERFGQPAIAVYDKSKVIVSLMKDGLSFEEATEYYEFNMLGAWVGDSTPAYLIPLENL